MQYKNPEDLLKEVKYAVEATSFEENTLYEKFKDKVIWKEMRSGLGKVVGEVSDCKVFLSLRFNFINDIPVLFWEATSMMVDHFQIEEWFDENTQIKRNVSAQNFHFITSEIKENTVV